MNRIGTNRWLILAAVLLAVWLIWSRLRIIFVVQLNIWSLLLITGLLALGIYAALRQLRAP